MPGACGLPGWGKKPESVMGPWRLPISCSGISIFCQFSANQSGSSCWFCSSPLCCSRCRGCCSAGPPSCQTPHVCRGCLGRARVTDCSAEEALHHLPRVAQSHGRHLQCSGHLPAGVWLSFNRFRLNQPVGRFSPRPPFESH